MGDEDKPKDVVRIVRCPRCRKTARYDVSNEFRPFCSARCKNEDIVAWAQEDYKVAAEPVDPAESSEGEEG